MTATAAAELNRLEDSDRNPAPLPRYTTLQERIATAEAKGEKWFYYGQCEYRKDWRTGQWKGAVSK